MGTTQTESKVSHESQYNYTHVRLKLESLKYGYALRVLPESWIVMTVIV